MMSNLVASETPSLEGLRGASYSNGYFNVPSRDRHVIGLCFIQLTTVTVFTGLRCHLLYSDLFLRHWGYHPYSWIHWEVGFLLIESEVCHSLWSRDLLNFVKVNLSFFLHSKRDQVPVIWPLMHSFPSDNMSHPTPEFRVHASEKAIDQ